LTDADLAPAGLRTKRGYQLLLSRTAHVSTCLDTNDYEFQTTVKTTSANSSRLGCSTGNGWVAVGDAALSFDPVSSQGILNALFTGMKAGEAVAEKLSGRSEPLSNYEKRLGKIYNAYLENRLDYYRLEKRWTTRPFWRRRCNLRN
jgi:flavin-dependent dehydrogenase